jgi:acyl carrier protein
MEIPEGVEQFVSESLIKDKEKKNINLQEVDDWLANGLIDSVGIIQLVSFVERKFNTTVPEEDVTVENFKSLKDVAQYLEKRKTARDAKMHG